MQACSTYRLIEKTDSREVSIYTGELTPKAVSENFARIRIVWPELFNHATTKETEEFTKIFGERLRANNFSDEKFRDAVNYVFDNYKAWTRKPQIADFVSFDKTIPVFTQIELLDKYRLEIGIGNNPINRYYTYVDINGIPYYVRNEDAIKYNLKPFKVEKPEYKQPEDEPLEDFDPSIDPGELLRDTLKHLTSKPVYNPKKFSAKEKADRQKHFEKIIRGEE